jgi:hypothetical protein
MSFKGQKPVLVVVVLIVIGVLSILGTRTFAYEDPPPTRVASLAMDNGVNVRSPQEIEYLYKVLRDHTFLQSGGSAVILKSNTLQNNVPEPLTSQTWCYYWGSNQSNYTNIFAKDAVGTLVTERYMRNDSSYGWGQCIKTIFRNPLANGQTYSYSHSVRILNFYSPSGSIINAAWWMNPYFVQQYIADVRWPFNHEGVTANPTPDELHAAQALWYRTNLDGPFSVNIRVQLGSTMAVDPLSQGTPPFNGQDIPWEHRAYGYNTGNNIGEKGCYLVSANMAMNYYARVLGFTETKNPEELNNWLATLVNGRPRGFGLCSGSSYCLVDPSQIPNASRALFDSNGNLIQFRGTAVVGQNFEADFRENLQNNWLALLNVNNGGIFHFVLVTGITQVGGVTTLSINDPWDLRGSTTLLQQYNNQHLENVRWFSMGDESVRANYVSIQVNSPLHLLVLDQDMRMTGYDPLTGTSFSDIPESSYFSDYAPGAVISNAEEVKVFEARILDSTNYTVYAIGTGDGPYTLSFRSMTHEGNQVTREVRGYIEEGKVHTFELEYDPDEGLILANYENYLPLIIK